ncbi:MAG: PQQ-binding-like beta-propeller repeat protein [Planctomycetaceae bacterium]|nr:PQQ-binding-like beta-propeller repeat protein [Planctomycetaceae bacterium]
MLLTLAPTLNWSDAAAASDWLQWRGPSGNGIAGTGQGAPIEWSSTKNVIWKTDIPGRGHSSPTIVGDLIVLTTADEQAQVQGLIAFDRESGKQKWITPVSQGGFPKLHNKNTHASSTVASDGTLFFAVFNHHRKLEAAALDAAGKIVWKRDVGGFDPKMYEYGYAASPTIYKDTLIITGNCDTISWMKALDLKTGKEVWSRDMPKGLVWSSPIVANVAGREQLLLSGFEKFSAYDPNNGQPLWSVPCLTHATCGTAIWDNNVAFASGGYPKAETVAVAADGSGRILWKNNVKCYEQSMLISDGYVYAFNDQGIFFCWEAATGREMWKSRQRGPVSASPVLVDGLIYASNELGTTYVFKASPEKFELIAENQLGDESFATPVFLDGRAFIRVASSKSGSRQESLFCIGTK